MSDHKLLKVTRFSKSFKQNPGFIRRIMMKHFNDRKFREKLQNSMIEDILTCTDVNTAAELVVSGQR